MANLKITECRITLIAHPTDKLVGFARVVLNDAFVVNGIRIVQGERLFVSWPREADAFRDKKFNICFPCSRQVQEEMSATILKAYEEALAAKSQPLTRSAGT